MAFLPYKQADCSDPTIVAGPKRVWSQKSATALFNPLTDAISLARINKVRVAFEMANKTEKCTIKGAYQVSNDGETWTNTTEVGSWLTSNDTDYAQSFATLTTNDKRLVRFGVNVKNVSGTETELAYASIRVDFRPC
jgi:hypothetical protein